MARPFEDLAQIMEVESIKRLVCSLELLKCSLHRSLDIVVNTACLSRLSKGVPSTSDKPLPAEMTV